MGNPNLNRSLKTQFFIALGDLTKGRTDTKTCLKDTLAGNHHYITHTVHTRSHIGRSTFQALLRAISRVQPSNVAIVHNPNVEHV